MRFEVDLVEQLIAEEEGRVRTAYPDSQGFLTIGIGSLVDKRVAGAGLCDAAIDAQFAHDSAAARHLASLFPAWSEHNAVRQAVLVSMCFQMGDGPLGWKHFAAALAIKDYAAAAAAGLDSEWARVQTPQRAEREMKMLSTGLWVNHA